jgi:BirA family biotin operon repressor/biotin-[acetyl-CoA-carboxylase] ligase
MDLPPLVIFNNIQHLPTVDSTNAQMKEFLSAKSLSSGFVLLTGFQESGRGQMGTSWQSAKDENVLISIFLMAKTLPYSHPFELNMSVCLALLDWSNSLHPGFSLKWPNDLLYGNRKVGGVLIENQFSTHWQSTIIGLGINLNQLEFDEGFRATSIRNITGVEKDLEIERLHILSKIEERLLASIPYQSLKKEYLEEIYGYEEWLEYEDSNGNRFKGKIEDIDEEGRLRIAKTDGRHILAALKDVTFLWKD